MFPHTCGTGQRAGRYGCRQNSKGGCSRNCSPQSPSWVPSVHLTMFNRCYQSQTLGILCLALWGTSICLEELTLTRVGVSGGCGDIITWIQTVKEKKKNTSEYYSVIQAKRGVHLRKNGVGSWSLPLKHQRRPASTKQLPHSFSMESNSYSSELPLLDRECDGII